MSEREIPNNFQVIADLEQEILRLRQRCKRQRDGLEIFAALNNWFTRPVEDAQGNIHDEIVWVKNPYSVPWDVAREHLK